jgi:hypothetical protein
MKLSSSCGNINEYINQSNWKKTGREVKGPEGLHIFSLIHCHGASQLSLYALNGCQPKK